MFVGRLRLPPPDGVEDIVIGAGSNKMIARGSNSGIEKLRELMVLVNRPRIRIGFDYWLVQVDDKDLPGDKIKSQPQPNTFVGYVIADGRSLLKSLEQATKARILLQSRESQPEYEQFSLLSVVRAGSYTHHVIDFRTEQDETVSLQITPGGSRAQVKAKLRRGDTIAVTAPGFTRDDRMMLFIQIGSWK